MKKIYIKPVSEEYIVAPFAFLDNISAGNPVNPGGEGESGEIWGDAKGGDWDDEDDF